MAAADAKPGLSFPRDTFASLTPKPFLLAHLKAPKSTRPSGRSPSEFRKPTVNTGSLSHSNGSALVRVGDTAIVCGVRAEILLASDVAKPPSDEAEDIDIIEQLGLLVPNLELSTGCSPAHMPGNPPSSVAQSLSYRISSLLNDSGSVNLDDLRITYTQPAAEDDGLGEPGQVVTKAYWTLYVDILCLALDGNALDAAWLAVYAALRDTRLPGAHWDADRESVVCSPLALDEKRLRIRDLPIVSTFAIFTTASPLKLSTNPQNWILADPDAFEEELCNEVMSVVIQPSGEHGRLISRLESSGGASIDRQTMYTCLQLAEARFQELNSLLHGS